MVVVSPAIYTVAMIHRIRPASFLFVIALAIPATAQTPADQKPADRKPASLEKLKTLTAVSRRCR